MFLHHNSKVKVFTKQIINRGKHLELSKIELDILNLRTEGYVLSYDDIRDAIYSLCDSYCSDEKDYITVSSTLFNKMWKNDNKLSYFKSDTHTHKNIANIIYEHYRSSYKGKGDITFLFNYDKENKRNKIVADHLNNLGWYYSY